MFQVTGAQSFKAEAHDYVPGMFIALAVLA